MPKFSLKVYKRVVNSEWNNAKILGYSLYSPDMSYFQREFEKCNKKFFGDFLKCFETHYNK